MLQQQCDLKLWDSFLCSFFIMLCEMHLFLFYIEKYEEVHAQNIQHIIIQCRTNQKYKNIHYLWLHWKTEELTTFRNMQSACAETCAQQFSKVSGLWHIARIVPTIGTDSSSKTPAIQTHAIAHSLQRLTAMAICDSGFE